MATSTQEKPIQIQGWGMGSVSLSPLLRLRCRGKPQPAHSSFLPPRPSSPEHTFVDVAVSTTTNESVDDADLSSSSPVSIAAIPTSVGNIKVGHGSMSGVFTNSRISQQKSYSNAVTGSIPSLTVSSSTSMSASCAATHLRLLPNGVPHSPRTEEEASSRLVIPLRNTSHDSSSTTQLCGRDVSRSRA